MKITLKASGSQAPDDMPAGEWIVRCEHGKVSTRGNQISAVLACIVLGRFTDKGFTAENEGVILNQWYFLAKIQPNTGDVELVISPHSKYGTAWALAMGRPLKSNDDPDPSAFAGKVFRVDVGYSSASGGSFSYKNLGRKKDQRDFLRIHRILEKIEEKALGHMTPMTQWGHKHAHVNDHDHEHEHDARASTSTPAPAVAVTPAVAPTATETDDKVIGIRMIGVSHMSNEQAPQGHHADLAPGDLATPGITPDDVLRVFSGAKVIEKPAGREFRLLATKNV